jgi:iron complex outermembrane recepter protein
MVSVLLAYFLVVMDNVIMENVVLKNFPLFDIEQVEVIRGPQGTLFGRNTTAGIVKLIQ